MAVVCFVCAVCALCSAMCGGGGSVRCGESAVPWRWFRAADFMDLLLRIDYVSDVPM
jgi:hypothetical protein